MGFEMTDKRKMKVKGKIVCTRNLASIPL